MFFHLPFVKAHCATGLCGTRSLLDQDLVPYFPGTDRPTPAPGTSVSFGTDVATHVRIRL